MCPHATQWHSTTLGLLALQAGEHAEVFDAYDAAVAASAAQVQEAQAAAAALAAQLADAELQLQQHSRTYAAATAGRCSSPTQSAEALAVAAAVESHAARAGRNSDTANRGTVATGPLAALRQHQKSLEKQLAKQHAELTKLQRENLRLMRFKKQFESAGVKLKEAAASQAAAEAAAQQAGLRAAFEAGKAERLQQQVRTLSASRLWW
jgi:hypothetical protein